jgi:hypothetical protein
MGERRWKTSGSSISRVVFGIFNILLTAPKSLDLHVDRSWKPCLTIALNVALRACGVFTLCFHYLHSLFESLVVPFLP